MMMFETEEYYIYLKIFIDVLSNKCKEDK